ncbi:MAG: hypothetical protein GY803_07105 [Chloroflexi bacterium]|nr:hypothetical protein [Chloroflexota bacterium]
MTDLPNTSEAKSNKRPILWLGCGLVALVLLCVGLIVGMATGIVALAFGSIKSSDVYQQAMTEATSNPELLNALGQPIEAGWLVSGSVSIENASGEANVSIPISGPKGKGTLYVEATKSAGSWQFDLLQAQVDGRPDHINLLSRTGR